MARKDGDTSDNIMQYVIIENGYHEETSEVCYTVIYTNPKMREFYFRAKSGSKTVDKVAEKMDSKGFDRYYVVEDSGRLIDLWEGYEDEETILSYIEVTL